MKRSKTEIHVYREWTITIKPDISKKGNFKGHYLAHCYYENGIGRVDDEIEVLDTSGLTVDQAMENAKEEIDRWWESIS